MNIRTRGRWLAARLRKLERAYAAMPQTTGQISNNDDGVVTSRPGQPDETTSLGDASEEPDEDTFTGGESSENRLPEEVSGAVPVVGQSAD